MESLRNTTSLAIRELSQMENEIEDNLKKTFVGKFWQVFKCSPLFNFKYDEVSMKNYSIKLSTQLENELGINFRNVLKDIKDAKLTANIESLKGVKTKSSDCEAIKIKVAAYSERNPKVKKFLMRVILCAVNADEVEHSEVTWLPVLICKGRVKIIDQVIDFLMLEFSCAIVKLSFSPIELKWMLAIWLDEESSNAIHIYYETGQKNLSTISLMVENEYVQRIWKEIQNDSKEILIRDVESLILCLENHYHHLYNINLSMLTVTKIISPALSANSEGFLTIYSRKHIQGILGHLTMLCRDTI